ncbi:MAG: serine hydrolase domain-containing protein [Phenylobacterium sp.]
MNPFARIAAMGAVLIAVCGFAQGPAAPPLAPRPAPAPAAAPATAHALTAEDVGAYFDGLIPDAINRSDIAGAVVVVVKDGQPLFERGYGVMDVKSQRPVDPQTTLFRPGSVSKLFAWTAVMQQVEAGKIDLDADVNRYLDFKIPAYHGKPVTMRNLMTHSAGFSDAGKDLILADPKRTKSLEASLKSAVPERIFPPGEVPAYSNYGASLAGYIVERVSGEPFADYVAKHIFAPLGMTRSTFAQPLPPGWAKDMATGYPVASKPAGPFELIGQSPAGGLSSTGADMGRFMIAHLQDGEYQGQRILAAKTAELMHSAQFRPVPTITAMALGFYEDPGNGHRVIAHAGDTAYFHSDLHIFPDDGVGLFVSFNSGGKDGAAHGIRTSAFRGFTDRYFPAPAVAHPTWKDAKADAATLSGHYLMSRRSDSGWFRLVTHLLGQVKVTADKDGILTVSAFKGLNGQPQQWREIGPFQYQAVNGESRLAAVVEDGKVKAIMTDDLPPAFALQPVPASLSATWNLPLFYLTAAILIFAALGWPIAAIIRRRYGHAFALAGRSATLYRLTRATCVTWLVFAGSWVWFLSQKDDNWFSSGHDWIIRLIQLVGLVGVVGTLAVLANVVQVFRDPTRSWWAKVSSVLIAIACLACVWFVVSLRLITPQIAY